MVLTFTDDELETYFRLQHEAEEFLNRCIRKKRAAQYAEFIKDGTR